MTSPSAVPGATPSAVPLPGLLRSQQVGSSSSPHSKPSDKKTLGQFFTRHETVHRVMSSLVTATSGSALEPSAGEGHLVRLLEQRPFDVTAVELDRTLGSVCATTVTHADFFAWADSCQRRFDVVLGNPPYVAWKATYAATRAAADPIKQRYTGKVNLYVLFIDRLIDMLDDGGELVLIVPKEWLYLSSAGPLRTKLAAAGAVTHMVDCGEEKLFADAAVPALLIFRFVRGARQGRVRTATSVADADRGRWQEVALVRSGHRWLFLDDSDAATVAGFGTLGDLFSVRVGMVTGADPVFRLPDGHDVESCAVRMLVTTRRTAEAFIDVNWAQSADELPERAARHLVAHKQRLLDRRIAPFHEGNWWKYGAVRNAQMMRSDADRLFALGKTRSSEPFFTADAKWFSGGVLGLFLRPGKQYPGGKDVTLAMLNSAPFRRLLDAMGLSSNGKVSLQPTTLEDVPFPANDEQAAAFQGAD